MEYMNRIKKILNYYKVNYKYIFTLCIILVSFYLFIYLFVNYILDTQGSIIPSMGLLGIFSAITHIIPSNINWFGKYKRNNEKINDIDFDVSFEIKIAGQFDKLYRLYISNDKIYVKNQFDFNNYDIEFDLEDIRKINVNGKRLEFNLKNYSPFYVKTRYLEQIKSIIEKYIESKQSAKETI